MSYRVAADVLPEEAEGNFFLRHWRGHLSLPKSWFLVGMLSAVFIQSLLLGLTLLEDQVSSVQMVAIGWLLFFLVFAIVRGWTLVGIWRSAGRHRERGGTPAWGVVARVLLLVGLALSLVQAREFGQQAYEMGAIAMGHDPLGTPGTLTASADGRELRLAGAVTAGTFNRFQTLAAQMPELKMVELESQGGRILEAQRIADLVRQRQLDTRTEKQCQSACTLILLAGKDRFAAPLAAIGFHQPDFPGLSDAERAQAIARNRTDYLTAGMSPAFVDRIMATPPNDMWFPTNRELVDAGVLNGAEVTVGGKRGDDPLSERLRQEAAAINRKGQVRIDRLTSLTGATADAHRLIINYQVALDREQLAVGKMRAALEPGMERSTCQPGTRDLVDAGAQVVFHYADQRGRKLLDLSVDRCA